MGEDEGRQKWVNFPRASKHLLTANVIPFSDIELRPTRTEQVYQVQNSHFGAYSWPTVQELKNFG